jgi:hypothetical protein
MMEAVEQAVAGIPVMAGIAAVAGVAGIPISTMVCGMPGRRGAAGGQHGCENNAVHTHFSIRQEWPDWLVLPKPSELVFTAALDA